MVKAYKYEKIRYKYYEDSIRYSTERCEEYFTELKDVYRLLCDEATYANLAGYVIGGMIDWRELEDHLLAYGPYSRMTQQRDGVWYEFIIKRIYVQSQISPSRDVLHRDF